MSTWDGKSKATPLGYKIFIALLRYGGLKPAYKLLHFVVLYYLKFVPKATKPILYLYEKRMGFDKSTSKKMLKKNIFTFGQSLLDKIYALNNGKNKIAVERTGGHFLNEMVHAGTGGILVTAHIGNYELAGQLLERLESKINIVMFDGENAQIKQYLESVSEAKTFNVIYIKENMSHIYEISAALARNEFVCIAGDRYVEGTRTISKTFFGKEAKFPFGPFIMASKLKAPVSFVFALREGDYNYHFFSTEPKVYAGKGSTGAEIMLEDYIEEVEKMVKLYPEQWFNYFDFWEDIPT